MELKTILNGLVLLSILPQRSFEGNITCTRETTACPSPLSWKTKSREMNCIQGTYYVCLQNKAKHLVEGCFPKYKIQGGEMGCPYVITCNAISKYPVLTQNDYHSCPPSTDGCPEANHSGYYIYDIHKYTTCIKGLTQATIQESQGVTIRSDELGSQPFRSTTKIQITTYVERFTMTMPSKPGTKLHISIIVTLVVGLIAVAITVIICIRWKAQRGRNTHKGEYRAEDLESPDTKENLLEEMNAQDRKEEGYEDDSTSQKSSTSNEYKCGTSSLAGTSIESEVDSERSDSIKEKSMRSQWAIQCYGNYSKEKPCNGKVESYCATCGKDPFFCKKCGKRHSKEYNHHDVIPYVNNKMYCEHHGKCPVIRYCSRCQEYICLICITPDEGKAAHYKHPTERLTARIHDMKIELKPTLGDIKSSTELLRTEYDTLVNQWKKVEENKKINEKIRETKIREIEEEQSIIKKQMAVQEKKKNDLRRALHNGDISTLESYIRIKEIQNMTDNANEGS